MVSHMQVPTQQGKQGKEGRKTSWQSYILNRVHVFPLAESLPGKESSPCWALLSLQGMRAPFLVSHLYLIEVSVY